MSKQAKNSEHSNIHDKKLSTCLEQAKKNIGKLEYKQTNRLLKKEGEKQKHNTQWQTMHCLKEAQPLP